MPTPLDPSSRPPTSPHDYLAGRQEPPGGEGRESEDTANAGSRDQVPAQFRATSSLPCFPVAPRFPVWRWPSSSTGAAGSQAECLVFWNLSSGPQPATPPYSLLCLHCCLPHPQTCWLRSLPGVFEALYITSFLYTAGSVPPPVPCTSFSEDGRRSYIPTCAGPGEQHTRLHLPSCSLWGGPDVPHSTDDGLCKVRQPPSPE